MPPNKQLQRTVIDKVPGYVRRCAAAEPRRRTQSTDNAMQILAKRWQGMKVAGAGVAIAGVGFGLAWFLSFRPGLILFFVGWAVVVSGGLIHVRQMFREARLKRSDLYPRAVQPWER